MDDFNKLLLHYYQKSIFKRGATNSSVHTIAANEFFLSNLLEVSYASLSSGGSPENDTVMSLFYEDVKSEQSILSSEAFVNLLKNNAESLSGQKINREFSVKTADLSSLGLSIFPSPNYVTESSIKKKDQVGQLIESDIVMLDDDDDDDPSSTTSFKQNEKLSSISSTLTTHKYQKTVEQTLSNDSHKKNEKSTTVANTNGNTGFRSALSTLNENSKAFKKSSGDDGSHESNNNLVNEASNETNKTTKRKGFTTPYIEKAPENSGTISNGDDRNPKPQKYEIILIYVFNDNIYDYIRKLKGAEVGKELADMFPDG